MIQLPGQYKNKMTVGSVFSGIGAFDLGFERSDGYEITWQIEIDPFCSRVLAKHWPHVARYGDVRQCGIGRKYGPLPPVDVLIGGWPCQPHSLSGKRKASKDERDLWPEFARLIGELRPQYVVGENVPGVLSSEAGRFFGGLLRDLAALGYDAEWFCLRASDFGAPHRRERLFLVASPQSISGGSRREEWQSGREALPHGTGTQDMAYPTSQRLPFRGYSQLDPCYLQASSGVESHPQRCYQSLADPYRKGLPFRNGSTAQSGACPSLDRCVSGEIESCMGRVVDGASSWLDDYQWPARPGEAQYDWEPPRIVGRERGGANRIARVKALGNSIVVPCAEYVARWILEREGGVS